MTRGRFLAAIAVAWALLAGGCSASAPSPARPASSAAGTQPAPDGRYAAARRRPPGEGSRRLGRVRRRQGLPSRPGAVPPGAGYRPRPRAPPGCGRHQDRRRARLQRRHDEGTGGGPDPTSRHGHPHRVPADEGAHRRRRPRAGVSVVDRRRRRLPCGCAGRTPRTANPGASLEAVDGYAASGVDVIDLSAGLQDDSWYVAQGSSRDEAMRQSWREAVRRWGTRVTLQARKALAHPGSYSGDARPGRGRCPHLRGHPARRGREGGRHLDVGSALPRPARHPHRSRRPHRTP